MSTISTTVNVSGMTCGHCVSSVSEELEALSGVEKIDIDLNAGGISTVTITSTEAAVPLRNRRGSGRSRLPGGGQRGLSHAQRTAQAPPQAPSTTKKDAMSTEQLPDQAPEAG